MLRAVAGRASFVTNFQLHAAARYENICNPVVCTAVYVDSLVLSAYNRNS